MTPRERDRNETPLVTRRRIWPKRVATAAAAILFVFLVAAEPQGTGEPKPESKDSGFLGVAGAVVGLVGGLLGTIAFIWKYLDRFSGHLRVFAECEKVGSVITVLTKVENNHKLAKEIDFACLLVGPEPEDSIDTVREIAKALNERADGLFTIKVDEIRQYRDILALVCHSIWSAKTPIGDYLPFQANGRALIPLPFYYGDNVDIADETMQYRCSLKAAAFLKGKTYSVRFIVFPTGQENLERFTQDLLVA